MNCRFCHKGFSKGEHLRRHERSHTGARPFVCKDCKRAFSRQDSLMRHERLHKRTDSAAQTSSPPEVIHGTLTPESFQNSALSDYGNCASVLGHAPPKTHPPAANGPPQVVPAPEPDFDLIWPDSEDLFQTIMSSDVNQWQGIVGTLPLPAENYPASNVSFGSPSSFDDRAPSIGAIPSGGNHLAVHNVSKMIQNLSSSVTAALENTSITSVFLDECLHMFFVRFIPTFPVLHRATFVFRDCAHPLLLNAIAIGSLYLGPSDAVAKGEVLWRLAHTAVATSWQTLITHRGSYDTCQGVQLVLTALLGQIYGVLSKNGAIRTTSQALHALGFFWARHCGMFDSEPFSTHDLPGLTASKAEEEDKWKHWVSREIQRRAMLGHYMLDGLIAQMSGEPTSVRHASNQMRLPFNDAAFEAGTADDWLFHMRSQQADQPTFRSIFRLLFSPTDDLLRLGYSFSAFSLRVLLEGLQSFISDCNEDAEDTVGVPTKFEIRRALSRIYEGITQKATLPACDRLEILLRWHAVCLDAITSSSLLCHSVCTRCHIDQKIWPNSKPAKYDFDLVQWAHTHDGRRALLHAVAIQDIVEQLPRGRAHAIHMPSSLFAAATVYSVFSLAGLISVNLPSSVDWKDVLRTPDDPCADFAELSTMAVPSDTTRYIQDASAPDFGTLTTRNLLYEFNSVQKLFGCLSTQWGVAHDMEKVVNQWTTLCR